MKLFALNYSAALAALAAAHPALAQNNDAQEKDTDRIVIPTNRIDILVAATRDGLLQVDEYTGSALRVDDDDIRNRQVRDVAEVLRDVPGVAISAVAGQTQIRLRGSEANHTLVLVDGIEVSDPFAGEFDIGTLQAEIGSEITVLRGPQSALYGSDAIGGVVAYDSGDFEGFGGVLEGGSDGTFNAAVRVGVQDDRFAASLSGVIVGTDGQPNARGGVRDVGRESYTMAGKTSLELTENVELRAVGRFVATQGDFNDQDFTSTSPTFGLVIDSPDTRFRNEAAYGLVGAQIKTAQATWIHDLSFQFADIARDTFGPFGRTSGSDGDRLKASYVTGYDTSIGHQFSFAADWEREQFRNDDPFGFASGARQSIENVGLVGQYRYNRRGLDLSAAIRHDFNDRFADATTFRVGAAYRILEDTRFRASAGTGIKNPGFFELFGFFDGRFIGNADLEPEKSTSWEVGLDQILAGGNVDLALTYFQAELENEIFTTFPAPTFLATPANRGTESKQRGVELSLSASLGGGFSLNAAYTYLDAEEDGVTEVRRPESIASAALNWEHPRELASANLVIRHNGEAEDLAFTDPSFIAVRETLDDYTLVNLAGRVKLTEQIEAFGRIENLLDERYEQVFSFVSPGRTAVIGLFASF